METLITALTWGLGTGLGLMLGIGGPAYLLVLMGECVRWWFGSDKTADQNQAERVSVESLAALHRRNDLTVKLVDHVGRITETLETRG